MRITLELLQSSPQVINAARERQLNLRGKHLEAIENLGSTHDQFECFDFTDNAIVKIGGGGESGGSFPLLKRLKTLIIANNHVSRIAEGAFDNLPGLESIVFTKNRLKTLTDLLPLGRCHQMQRLSLRENEVTGHEHYRPFMVYIMRNTQLRFLDFQKVTEKEKGAAIELFEDQFPNLLAEIAPPRVSREEEKEAKKRNLTPEQQRLYAKLIAGASSQSEIESLRAAWERGEAPPEEDDESPQETDDDGNKGNGNGSAMVVEGTHKTTDAAADGEGEGEMDIQENKIVEGVADMDIQADKVDADASESEMEIQADKIEEAEAEMVE